MLAERTARSGRASRARIMMRMATVSTAMGIAVMVVTLAVVSGFRHRIYGDLRGFAADVQAVADIAREKGATLIVCGLPVNFDGSEALQTQKTARFIEALKEKAGVPVVCEDERFTTMMAHDTLISEGMSRQKRKNYVDALAAANILDGYLNKINKEHKNGR